MRALGMDPVHDTRRCYRALVDAFSRPGSVQSLSDLRPPADRAVLATLVDGETTLHSPDEELREALASQGRLDAAEPEEAAFLHWRGTSEGRVAEAPRGTLVEPSDGATALYRLHDLAEGAGPLKAAYEGTTVEVSGPGVPDLRTLTIALPVTEVEAVAEASADYPRGVDTVLTTADDLVALPRSVTVEVV